MGLGELKLGWGAVGMVGTMSELGRGVKSDSGVARGGGIVGNGSAGRRRLKASVTSD